MVQFCIDLPKVREEGWRTVRYKAPKTSPYYAMPRSTKEGVEILLDGLGYFFFNLVLVNRLLSDFERLIFHLLGLKVISNRAVRLRKDVRDRNAW